MTQILNQARFDQKADFNGLLLAGTDIDFFSEIDRKLYLLVEWKCSGTDLPKGQRIGFERHTNDLGQVKPTFHVVAYHDTEPTELIKGTNSTVGSVFFRLPNMPKFERYNYRVQQRPTLNQWLGDFSYEWRLQKVLTTHSPLHLWEGIPQICLETWDRVEQPKGPSAFFDHIRSLRQAYEFG